MRILIVEDNAEMRESLKNSLLRESYAVDAAPDGQKGSFMARTNDYDLVILDNMLPLKDGLTVCKEIRSAGKTVPILMLSVVGEIDHKVNLLEAGADDYLTKPYSHRELLARIKSLGRRPRSFQAIELSAHNIFLDSISSKVKRGKEEIYLTRKEFSLLELLLRNKDKIVSRSMILEHVWDIDGDPLSKTVETHIVNLRKKIERNGKKIILNVHGRGYKIAS